MGIPIVPPEKVIGTGCPMCFEANKTPEALYCTISGIGKGVNWLPGMPDPLDGTFQLIWEGGCHWQMIAGLWEVNYSSIPGRSDCWARIPLTLFGIWGTSDQACNSWFVMEEVILGPKYYTPGASIIWMTDDCPIISLSEIAESVGLHPGADLLGDVWTMDNEQAVIRYAHKQDATNVKILLDCS